MKTYSVFFDSKSHDVKANSIDDCVHEKID